MELVVLQAEMRSRACVSTELRRARLGRSVRQRDRLRRSAATEPSSGQRWELDQVVTRRILIVTLACVAGGGESANDTATEQSAAAPRVATTALRMFMAPPQAVGKSETVSTIAFRANAGGDATQRPEMHTRRLIDRAIVPERTIEASDYFGYRGRSRR
jgi:hypothetical protein